MKRTTAVVALNTVLVGLKPAMPLIDGLRLLSHHGVSGAPVLDDRGEPIGMFCEDRCLPYFLADIYERASETTVGQAMTTPAPVVHTDTPLVVVAERMHEAGTTCVAVLNEQDILVGQINREDLVAALLEMARDGRSSDARFISHRTNEAQEGPLAGGSHPRLSVQESVGTETNWVYRRALEAGAPEEGGGRPEDYPYPGHRREERQRSEKPARKP